MRLVAYCRVSTDDKGQDPERQMDVLKAWAQRQGHLLVGQVNDIGTSGATDPFQRQFFREALAMAEEAEADGIAVEAVDRATRGGVEALMVLKAALRIDHDLTLKMANTPEGLPPALEELYDSTMAAVARLFRDRLKEQIKSGIARAKANGFPNGRPGRAPKPELTLAEQDLVRELVLEQSAGVDKVALEISRARGAFDVGDPGAMMARRVGPTWLWKQIARSQMVDVRERLATRRLGAIRKGGPRKADPKPAPPRKVKPHIPKVKPTTAQDRQKLHAQGVKNEAALKPVVVPKLKAKPASWNQADKEARHG